MQFLQVKHFKDYVKKNVMFVEVAHKISKDFKFRLTIKQNAFQPVKCIKNIYLRYEFNLLYYLLI